MGDLGMDRALMAERLRRRDSAFMVPSASRCAKEAAVFLSALGADGEADAAGSAKADFARELALFGAEVARASLAADACDDELKHYEQLQQQISEETRATETEIARLRGELAAERLVRRRREAYEALAHEVNAFPSKKRCVADIEALEGELTGLTETKASYDAKVEARRRQFSLLLQSLFDLQQGLEAEEACKPEP
uniref:THO complex subunit 7 homolog n=1 Tax=Phaeomonas parva TaxID=124430 RepID=A0A7S1XY76_9STRA|mmetsp:Transcript_43634/g.136916  ORF Transcript_43634/g.136916 Transcript_43634/m.136916 type:complete len:196 (+) Transcript_43634:361-948(+)